MMDDFELLSAYIDGEVNDEERARIESDPRLMNELNQILAISKKVGEVIPNDPETRANHIKTALNEMTVASSDSVIPIRSAGKSSVSFRRPAWLLGAVAAALLVIVAVPLFRSGDSSTTQIASEIIEEPDGESVVESAPLEANQQDREGADLAESAPFDSSPNSASIESEEITDNRADNDLVAENEADISEKVEEPQSEMLTSDEPTIAGLQAETTADEMVRRGPVNTYTSDNPNEYGSFLLQDVRIEPGESFDSFVIELTPTSDDPPSMIPGPYAIEINGEYLVGEDSYVLPTEINEYVVINLAARGGVWNDETGYDPSWGSITETITADESNLTGIYFGDFEANLTFVLGMEPNSTFRSYQTMDPPRLIIEVDHNS
ncbi:MAG: zf-HC2 domain-containing protein [Acidimicrobiales bacterium]|nr:zf-HC2 domain-containing protein [Acidimicrobiales bacterium]